LPDISVLLQELPLLSTILSIFEPIFPCLSSSCPPFIFRTYPQN